MYIATLRAWFSNILQQVFFSVSAITKHNMYIIKSTV